MATKFKLLLSLTKQPQAGPVYQKQDGQRFTACNTIKLNVNSTYTLSMTIRPQRPLKRVQVDGEKVEMDQVKPDRDDDDSCKYQTNWPTTAASLTKSGKRKDIPIVIEFGEGVTMKVMLQCKFYLETETEHCHWGQPLHNIEYDCAIPEGCTFVDVISTKYL